MTNFERQAADRQTKKDGINEDDVDDFFDQTKKDILEKEKIKELQAELVSIFDSWLDNQSPNIEERMKNFGLTEGEADRLIAQIKQYLKEDIRFITNDFEEFKNQLLRMRQKLENDPQISSAIDLIGKLSKQQLLELMIRKLNGEISDTEKYSLNLLNILKDQGRKATHNMLSEDISFSIFNGDKLDDYNGYLNHELTHFGLNQAVGQAAGRIVTGAKDKISNPKEFSVPFAFSSLLIAIDESAAHLAGKQNPNYSMYVEKIPQRTFAMIFESMKSAIKNMDMTERDHFFVSLYEWVAGLWRDDFTIEDIARCIVEIKIKCKTSAEK